MGLDQQPHGGMHGAILRDIEGCRPSGSALDGCLYLEWKRAWTGSRGGWQLIVGNWNRGGWQMWAIGAGNVSRHCSYYRVDDALRGSIVTAPMRLNCMRLN